MRYKNNPLNVRATSSKWIGATGKCNGFLEFESPVYGVRCALYLLKRTYRRWFGFIKLSQAIAIFAPPSENNTNNYIEFVCKEACLSRDSLVWFYTRDEWFRLLSAMCRMESGYKLTYQIFLKAYEMV